MSFLVEESGGNFTHPLDLAEELAGANKWSFDRSSPDDLHAEFTGRWCDYRLYFGWIGNMESMQFACHFDFKVPEAKADDVARLLCGANEHLWLGYFGHNRDRNILYFRHVILLRGSRGVSVEQLEDLVDIALEACERFYPAFQYVIWGGKPPAEALSLAMLETVGRA